MQKKSVWLYLLVTFGLGWALQIGGIYTGFISYDQPGIFSSLFYAAVMWAPALGALAVALLTPDKAYALPDVWPLPIKSALRIILAVFLVFALNYTLAGLLGFTTPQWHLSSLFNQLDPKDTAHISPNIMEILPYFLSVSGFLLSLCLGASLFAVAMLGGELGWRGCLLPRLAGRNRWIAPIITAVLWGLWFLPLTIGQALRFPDDNNLVMMVIGEGVTALLIGIVLGRITLEGRHLGLAALLLGCFVGQRYGMWSYLFPGSSLPWAGT